MARIVRSDGDSDGGSSSSNSEQGMCNTDEEADAWIPDGALKIPAVVARKSAYEKQAERLCLEMARKSDEEKALICDTYGLQSIDQCLENPDELEFAIDFYLTSLSHTLLSPIVMPETAAEVSATIHRALTSEPFICTGGLSIFLYENEMVLSCSLTLGMENFNPSPLFSPSPFTHACTHIRIAGESDWGGKFPDPTSAAAVERVMRG